MSVPWGKSSIGNWAAEAEAEEREVAAAAAEAAAATPADARSFPSLKEAVTAKPKKKKMTLSEFNSVGGGGMAATRLTPGEMMRLPTGPTERSAEEMQYGRLGGGFSSYGRDRGPPPSRSREDSDGSWGGGGGGGGGGRRSYGGFDDDRRGSSPRVSEFDQPSRADEVDNWASAKKALPSFDSGRQNRYSSLGGNGGGGGGAGAYGSRAADMDNWAIGKKPLPARSSTFGSGFRDSGPELGRLSRGAMGETSREPEQERSRLVLDPRKSDSGVNETGKVIKSNPFGSARPREEVLVDKGLDGKKLESEIEANKTSRPSSAHSSRPSSAQSNGLESQSLHGIGNVIKPRPKVNPFGDAKPREVLLEEKGLDWRKIDLDLEHRAIERPETEEEKLLKEELDDLKKQVEKQSDIQEIILQKEKELEFLIHDLDDKVRFGQKAVDRPGSGGGRAAGFADRPPPQSGSHGESRSTEYVDRPRSRGTGDARARSGEDRRGFQGGRDRGYLGNRDMDRPRSRERW